MTMPAEVRFGSPSALGQPGDPEIGQHRLALGVE